MNGSTADQWAKIFYMPTDGTANKVSASGQTGDYAGKYINWLDRITNQSYEAWIARGGLQDEVE
ncbi:MAG: hypothetical protein P8J29_08765 [Rhodospirillales bacterium]|nr:hypothetical protein [Rhodospirillales bacterium]